MQHAHFSEYVYFVSVHLSLHLETKKETDKMCCRYVINNMVHEQTSNSYTNLKNNPHLGACIEQ